MRAVFLDKDGTLVDDVPYNVDPALLVLARHAGAALRLLRALGYRLYVVSNQSGVARGRFDEAALGPLFARLEAMLAGEGVTLDGVFWCPHHPDGVVAPYAADCACRKPRPGMLQHAAVLHGIDLQASWMVGDILDDIEAGRRAGCRTILVDVGNETEWRLGGARSPHHVAAGLAQAAEIIVGAQ